VAAGILQILGIRVLHVAGLNGFGHDGRLNGRAEHLRIQRAAHREHRVAQDLRLNPQRTAPPEKAVVWISLRFRGIVRRVLKIDRAGHDEPVQRF
jgi:hypothetical protein